MNFRLSSISGIDDALIAFEILMNDFMTTDSLDINARLIVNKCYNLCGFLKRNLDDCEEYRRLNSAMKAISKLYDVKSKDKYSDVIKMIHLTFIGNDLSFSDVINIMDYSEGANGILNIGGCGYPLIYNELTDKKVIVCHHYALYSKPFTFDIQTCKFRKEIVLDDIEYIDIGSVYLRKSILKENDNKKYSCILKVNLHDYFSSFIEPFAYDDGCYLNIFGDSFIPLRDNIPYIGNNFLHMIRDLGL